MLSYKSSLLAITLLFTSASQASFTDMECIDADFQTEVRHKGQPFGLTENVLKIDKKKCVLTVEHEKFKYLKNKWIIDVCRGPVHVKSDKGSIEVIKRKGDCIKGSKSEFCATLSTIESIIQDDGLIFADGEKEDLNSDHGKAYCSFLLTKKYLRSGMIFNKGVEYKNVLSASGAIPVAPVVQSNTSSTVSDEVAPLDTNDAPADF